MFGTDTIEVDVSTSDGTIMGSKTVRIASVRPMVQLYADHTLYGIEYNHALSSQSAIADSVMSFSAAPYYAGVAKDNDPLLHYVWTVNSAPYKAVDGHSNEIALDANKVGGQAAITVALTEPSNVFSTADGSWYVQMGAKGGGGSGGSSANPFGQQ
jgi:hypothetical protein